ncbi:X-Pro dipeptidase [Caulobacter sp. CCUG 60055]|nr:Xaa-Pro peptidase family protein [Caulobacter sp. CCUG 60055]MBQ1542644.1 aminopeptidase P family protein [Caulobacteraceae bacterium]MCI3179447.1 X-Pro dipeptidase [Caulobacter sp. CCUG 60055]
MSQIGGSTAAAELGQLKLWPDRAAPISREERTGRIARARALMAEHGLDALLIGAGHSLRYFAGPAWGASERLVAMLLTQDGEPTFVAPVFERGSLEAELAVPGGLALWEEDESPHQLVSRLLPGGGGVLGLDPAMAFQQAERLRAAAPAWTVVDAAPVVDGCRMYKSPAEIALMQQAKSITLEVQRRAARILHPGVTASEVRRFIDEAHRALTGGTGSTFCIVQFGRSTAFPHGLPGENVLAEGDMVLIDTGTSVEGYNSDITRSYVFGQATDEQRSIWSLEREAQAAAFDAARLGEPCEAADTAARRVLIAAGLGPDYRLPGLPHRTGHGIGLSIHEPAYLVRGDVTPLAEGMCFSNEPMIVVPDRFGVRLEDHFHMTASGPRWFTEPSPAIDRPFA